MTARRYALVPRLGTGTDADPIRPDVAGSYVALHYFAARVLVKLPVPDGTPVDGDTLADIPTGSGDVTASPLTLAAREAIRLRLITHGIDVPDWPNPSTRRTLFRWLVSKLGIDPATALAGFDVSE